MRKAENGAFGGSGNESAGGTPLNPEWKSREEQKKRKKKKTCVFWNKRQNRQMPSPTE